MATPPTKPFVANRRMRKMMEGLEPLEKLVLPGLHANSEDTCTETRIHDEKLLASYTKLADNRICVPGRPPALVPLKQPLTLADDSRGWSYPTYTHPLEPLVRAVDLMTESRSDSDRYSGCEIVTTSGNLRRLYEFCRGVLAGRGPVDAMTRMKIPGRIERFDIQWSRDALLTFKWLGDPDLEICSGPDSSSRGFGVAFEDAACRNDDNDIGADDEETSSRASATSSYHRIVRYSLGPLQLLLQSEIDATYGPERPPPPPPPPPPSVPRPASIQRQTRHRSSASPSFEILELDDPGDTPSVREREQAEAAAAAAHNLSSPTLYIVVSPRRGRRHSQEKEEQEQGARLVEIKTSPVGRNIHPEAQLYFSRVDLLYHAQHSSGFFHPDNAEIREMTDKLAKWEKDNQPELTLLVNMLSYVCDKTREYTTAADIANSSGREAAFGLSLVCDCATGEATLYRRNDGMMLVPEDW